MKEVRKRSMKLSDYNISKEKYMELKYFCMQYRQKKEALSRGYGLHAAQFSEVPKVKGASNPTENAAIRNVMLREDIELIEETAREAGGELAPYILKSVIDGIAYEHMDPPVCRADFYGIRKYFFFLLSQRR